MAHWQDATVGSDGLITLGSGPDQIRLLSPKFVNAAGKAVVGFGGTRIGKGLGSGGGGGGGADLFATAALDLNFAGNAPKLAGVASSFATLLAVSRAQTVASYARTVAGVLTSFAANELRRTDMGVLIEESRTNLFLQSQTFDNASWVKRSGTITANAATAPDGTTTADKFVPDAGGTTHDFYQLGTPTSGTNTLSIYVKASGLTWVALNLNGVANAVASFNLALGTVGTVAGAAATKTASIEALADGWYRLILTATAGAGGASGFFSGEADNDWTYSADGVAGCFVWGCQLEANSFASSYIPTTTLAVARNQDSITTADIAWWNGSAGTLYAEGAPRYLPADLPGSIPALVGLDGGSAVELMTLRRNNGSGGKANALINDGNVAQASFDIGTWADAASHKLALAYAANDVRFCDAGTLGTPDTAATLPTPTTCRIGNAQGNGSTPLNGYLKRVAYFNTAANDAALQALCAA